MTPAVQTVVLDASVLVAALCDHGPTGQWAERQLRGKTIAAPHLVPAETTNALRRHEARGALAAPEAALAMRDLTRLPMSLYPFAPVAARVWELRSNLTSYDAWYVALAELLGAPLVTLDRRLAAAPGVRCQVITP